ncbi:hypothetical protein B0G69_5904 [Paraburkholderia sp. RAU2J]|nr:hypothetical protein B0G69_5904 [Paraburkholderia sp. RAU2J]
MDAGKMRNTAAVQHSRLNGSQRALANWRPDFSRIRGKTHLAIANQIEEATRLGVFEPGDRMSLQRAIATDPGSHCNTINAFREAARCGLVRECMRRRTIVL